MSIKDIIVAIKNTFRSKVKTQDEWNRTAQAAMAHHVFPVDEGLDALKRVSSAEVGGRERTREQRPTRLAHVNEQRQNQAPDLQQSQSVDFASMLNALKSESY